MSLLPITTSTLSHKASWHLPAGFDTGKETGWQEALFVEYIQESEIIELDSEVSEVRRERKDRKINSLPIGELKQCSDL